MITPEKLLELQTRALTCPYISAAMELRKKNIDDDHNFACMALTLSNQLEKRLNKDGIFYENFMGKS